MKHLLTLLAILTILASPAAAQTIKSLGFNTTNGRIVASTNLVWTNAFNFSTNTVAGQVRTNLALGETNAVTFGGITIAGGVLTISEEGESDVYVSNENADLALYAVPGSGQILAYSSISFVNTTNAAATRTNLGLPLPALTNTSNVTMMRALSGSTNTNHPFSGSVALTNTNVLVFSNGILQAVQ